MLKNNHNSSKRKIIAAITVALFLLCSFFGGLFLKRGAVVSADEAGVTITFELTDPISGAAVTKAEPGSVVILTGCVHVLNPADTLGWIAYNLDIKSTDASGAAPQGIAIAVVDDYGGPENVTDQAVREKLLEMFGDLYDEGFNYGYQSDLYPDRDDLRREKFNTTTYDYSFGDKLSADGTVTIGLGTKGNTSRGTASKHDNLFRMPFLIPADFNGSLTFDILKTGKNQVNLASYNSATGQLDIATGKQAFYADRGSLASTPITIQVGEEVKSSEAQLTKLGVGHGNTNTNVTVTTVANGGTASSSQRMSYTSNNSTLTNFMVSATASAKATISVKLGSQTKPVGNGSGNSGNMTLAAGNQTLEIKVTAEDGVTVTTYYLDIKMAYVKFASLGVNTTPTVSGARNGLSAAFNENTTSYTAHVPYGSTGSITTTVTAKLAGGYGADTITVENATGCTPSKTTLTNASSGSGASFTVTLSGATGSLKLKAVAADGTTFKEYTINFVKQCTDVELSNVTVLDGGAGGTALANGGSGNNYSYSLTAANGNKAQVSFAIPGTATLKVDNVAATSPFTKEYTLTADKTISVSVTAEAGNVGAYTIKLLQEVVGVGFTTLEYSLDGTSYTTITLSGTSWTETLKLDDYAVGTQIYFRATVPAGASISAGTGLTGSGPYTGTLAYGTNTYKLTVRGTSANRDYTFTVKLLEQKNGIVQVVSTTLADYNGGNATLTSGQTITVPYGVTSATFAVTTEGTHATLNVTGGTKTGTAPNFTVNCTSMSAGGTTTLTFTATDDNNKAGTPFTVKIARTAAESTNTLASLVVRDGNGAELTLSPAFSAGTSNYRVTLDDLSGGVNIDAVAAGALAKITGLPADGNINLGTITAEADGSKKVSFTVQAENGTSKTYTITFAEPDYVPDSDYEITEIVITGSDGKDYFAEYDRDTHAYTFEVPNGVDAVDIKAETASAKANLVGTGNKPVSVGENVYEVYAVAEDGSNQDGTVKYTFTVNRAAPVDHVSLIDLQVENQTIPNFNPDELNYSYFLPSDVTKVKLYAESEEYFARVEFFREGELLGFDQNFAMAYVEFGAETKSVTVSVLVTLGDAKTIYTLRLVRISEYPVLSYLNVSNYAIYDKDGNLLDGTDPASIGTIEGNEYFVEIESADVGVNIEARTEDETAEIRIQNNGMFSVAELFGEGIHARVQIAIVPESGEVATYFVNLKRKPAPTSNTNAGITIEEIEDFNLSYDNDSTLLGWYHVKYSVSTLTIDVILEQLSEAEAIGTYQIFYNKHLQNDNGEENAGVKLAYGPNTVSINIQSSDKQANRTVTVLVMRDEASLESANIKEIVEFKSDYNAETTDYFYSVGYKIKELNIEVTVGKGLSYKIDENTKLKLGQNTVHIYIFDIQDTAVSPVSALEDGNQAVRVISVNVYRENDGAYMVWLILFIIFMIIAILEGIIIICLLLRRRNNETNVTVASQPMPMVRVQPAQPQVQYVAVQPMMQPQQPQVQYVPMQAQPQMKPEQPVNVEVKITGFGESDGSYKTRK